MSEDQQHQAPGASDAPDLAGSQDISMANVSDDEPDSSTGEPSSGSGGDTPGTDEEVPMDLSPDDVGGVGGADAGGAG